MKDRIISIIQQEYYITKRSLEVIIDLFFFSTITIVVFGYVAKYLAGTNNTEAAFYLIIGLVLWEIVRVSQYSVTVSVLWNVWARNLSNMFVSPISSSEYLLALIISSVIKSIIVLSILGVITKFVFDFDILQIGILNLVLHFINLSIFAWSIGVFVTGLIFRFGTRIQAMSWGLIFLFQPLSAAFFPIDVLPTYMQSVSKLIPATYVFEAARNNFKNPATDWQSFITALVINIIYLIFSFVFFHFMFRKSRQTGQFARNEG